MNWIFFGLLFQVTAADLNSEQEFCACQKVMVVSPDLESEAAAATFVSALGASATVFPDAPLGDLSGLGDDEIATRASRFDVDTVVVVRALPISNGTRTLYTRYDVAKKSWSIRQTEHIVDLEPAILHASSLTMLAASRAEQAQHEEAMTLRRGDFNRKSLAPTQDPFVFALGVDKTALAEADFYRFVGRPDLAQTYQDNVRRRQTVLISSGVAAALGTGLTFVGFLGGGAEGEMPQQAIGITGAVTLALGAAGLIYGGGMDTQPVDAAEAKRLADDFNRRLSQNLELPP